MKDKILLLICTLCFSIIGVYALEDKVLTVTVGSVDAPVYNVEVTWESMEFIYNEQVNYIWDKTTHKYELSESTYYWSNQNNKVKVINNSHYAIDVNLQYKSINEDINGKFDIESIKLSSGISKDFELILKGSLSSNNTSYIKVGTIELNIS